MRTSWCASWLPWLKLNLAMFMPASRSFASISSPQHLGPIVQRILVLRIAVLYLVVSKIVSSPTYQEYIQCLRISIGDHG